MASMLPVGRTSVAVVVVVAVGQTESQFVRVFVAVAAVGDRYHFPLFVQPLNPK